MKVTVKYIADSLGMSPSTVSRALNDSDLISKATRDRVKSKALELGYFNKSMNIVRNYSKPYIKLLGVSVPNLDNPICVEVVKGIQEYFDNLNYNILVMDSNEHYEREQKNIQTFLNLDVQGLIVFPTTKLSSEYVKRLTEDVIPTVYVCNISEDKTIHSVGIDERNAFFKLTQYLIQLGHKHIVMLGGSEKFENRVQGFRSAAKIEGITDAEVIYCPATQREGFNRMKNLLESGKQITGVVAAADYLAMGILDAVYQCGKSIPDDISLISLDNIDISGNKRINLTTVNQPGKEIGMKASEIIFQEIRNGSCEYKRTEIFDVSLVIRGSCRSISEDGIREP